LPRLRQLIRLLVPDPRDGCGAAAVFYEMVEEAKPGDGGPDTKEAEALAAALNHSAERVQTLWFSFLTFTLYLAIATGTTTHRMLFREDPLNLPVLNIALPLLGFYVLTPIIFVTYHFYMLLNLVLLARTAKSFEDSLARAFPDDGEARETFRMRIENTLFVQLLVGGRLEREGFNAKLLGAMALITVALAPVALMLMIQIMFLPYHSEWITWLHRGLLALDLALVWTLWPGYRSGWGVRLWPNASWLAFPGPLSVAALAYAVVGATFPDERIHLATNWLRGSHFGAELRAKITPVNTLGLHGEDLIDDAKLKQIIEKDKSSTVMPSWVATLRLRSRDLTEANLTNTDVRRTDFSNAILNRANLMLAWVNQANFSDAQLQGANLSVAQLQGAFLDGAQLQGASLNGAQLQGASLKGAQLQGASLTADLQGAWLEGARLQGASLYFTRLQGASLDGAQLQGASLEGAQLQGASLEGAQLQGASLMNVCAWRADARKAIWKDTRVVTSMTAVKDESPKESGCNWTATSFEDLKNLIAMLHPIGLDRFFAMERIEPTLDPTKALGGEDEMAKVWADRESESPAPKVYEKSLAEQWQTAGCAAEGAPYVLRALLNRLGDPKISPFAPDSPETPKLAAAFLAKDCAGTRGLSDAVIAKLTAIRDRAPRPAPKP
jgi:uncharacterized protein YjbI with pentapeptide repeats